MMCISDVKCRPTEQLTLASPATFGAHDALRALYCPDPEERLEVASFHDRREIPAYLKASTMPNVGGTDVGWLAAAAT